MEQPNQVTFDASGSDIVIRPESQWVYEQLHGERISPGYTEGKEGIKVPIYRAHDAKTFLTSKDIRCEVTDKAHELMEAWRKVSD